MKYILGGVKFGEVFGLRDGRKACFLGRVEPLMGKRHIAYQMLIEGEDEFSFYTRSGKSLYCDYFNGSVEIDFKQLNSKEDSWDDIVKKYIRK